MSEGESDSLKLFTAKKLCRSNTDFIFGGICGGLAEYNSIDPFWIRTVLALSLLITPWAFAVYVVAIFLLPKSMEQVDKNDAEKRRHINKYFLSGIILLLISTDYFFSLFGTKRDPIFIFISDELALSLLILITGVYNLLFARKEDQITNGNSYFRSLSDKKLLGVCSGFAKYFNLDILLVRFIVTIVSLITFGLFILIYFYIGMRTEGRHEIIL